MPEIGAIVEWDGRDAEVMRVDSVTPPVYWVKLCGGRGGWVKVGDADAIVVATMSALDARKWIKTLTTRDELVDAYNSEIDGKSRASVLSECDKRAIQLDIEL